jgi:hypothetical protein
MLAAQNIESMKMIKAKVWINEFCIDKAGKCL